ncbi:GNAT family N-acetyltransferase [Pseudonocardia endophytica]|uniref:Ribosomal protein S18 acetylase RimI-like enzyme n=1 Tax=Pseudonocardia endophytica TaxID=401976 RepID=A0A4R1HV87_PSEEN|nr:GNAT family N-acetyltransferase [Pseudonocardia endophytica]TCK21382.1 ribosomal protein S18 acetylase RimI-like enzyme [Pseudonocardia endophytica]
MSKRGPAVRELSPGEWQILRTTRLRALWESPQAFASTYFDEAHLDESQWRRRLEQATWLVAVDGRAIIGMAGLVVGDEPEAPHIESIWVDASHRRLGVFRTLLGRAVEIGRATGWDSLYLWVVGNNHVARCAYTSVGFKPTGEEQPLPADGNRIERRFELDVGGW